MLQLLQDRTHQLHKKEQHYFIFRNICFYVFDVFLDRL